MKKVIATFVALVLMPSLNTYAWVGGPFSNNSYSEESGDDGAYEATASMSDIDTTTGTHFSGVGLYRFGVNNNFDGFTDQNVPTVSIFIPQVTVVNGNTIVTTIEREIISVTSGNLLFGGFGGVSHSWFINGIAYFGSSIGNVSSISETVYATGYALSDAQINPAQYGIGLDSVSSGFSGRLSRDGDGAAVNRFSAIGSATVTTRQPAGTGNPPTTTGQTSPLRIDVFGARFSKKVTYGI